MISFDFVRGPVKLAKGDGYPFCHSVLIEDRIKAVIDASCDRDKLLAIQDAGPVDYLINSHAHEDHLVFNYLFPGAIFHVHPFDAPHFENLESLIESYGEMPAGDREKWRIFLREECHYVPRRVDRFLKDGDVIHLGKVEMEVVHTPGHTKGHCAFYFIRERIMFTADLDLIKAGPYYGDPGSEIEETIQSLERLKTFDVETYLTAHGKGIHDGNPAHIDRYLEIIYLREERLMDLLRKGPKTLDQIAQEGIIYGGRSISTGPWDLLLSERNMMEKHLIRLIRRGLVGQEGKVFLLKN